MRDTPHASRAGSTIRLSVVIPTWNAVDLAARAIEHLGDATTPEWAELIVVDDGSEDGTAEAIRRRCPGVVVVTHEVNRGFGAAVNTGFARARGRYLAAVNNDALVTWPALDRLTHLLEEDARAAAAAPAILDDTGRPQRVGFELPRLPWPRLPHRGRVSGRVRGGDDEAGEAPRRAGYLKGACVVFARRALEDVGLFDEQFYMFAEEIDLFQRLRAAGWTVWTLPEVRVTHRAGATTRNHPEPDVAARFRVRSYRSMCVYYRKHHRWPVAALLRGALAARLGGRLLRDLLTWGGGWRRPHGPRERLACLAAVLGPCRSQPQVPRLPPRAGPGPGEAR